MLTPKDYGLPHDEWRNNQLESINKVIGLHRNGGGHIIQGLGTGSGKSAIATALSVEDNVLVLVHNHGLLEQYERIYGFDIIKGRQEYPCELSSKVKTWTEKFKIKPTASDCHYDNMYECPAADKCGYLIAREKAINSRKMACTYKYAALSSAVRNRTGFLVMDEAHDSADEILSTASFRIGEDSISKYDFPSFPFDYYGTGGDGDILTKDDKNKCIGWLAESMQKISFIDLFNNLTPMGASMKRMLEYLSQCMDMLINSEDVFLKTEEIRGTTYIVFRPMEAKSVSNLLWSEKKTVLLMSATIGNPKPLAGELGIDRFIYDDYPHPIPPKYRPVYDLGMPKMVKANLDANPSLFALQAIKITKFVKMLPEDWRGIILTTSYYKVERLIEFLTNMLDGRIVPFDRSIGLNERIHNFMQSKDSGKIAVDTIQGWGTGLDLYGDVARFAVIAGTPFYNPTDRYDMLRLSRFGGRQYSLWSTYTAIPQAAGRISRGEMNQYNQFETNVAAIADGSCTTQQALGYYPKWFSSNISGVTV